MFTFSSKLEKFSGALPKFSGFHELPENDMFFCVFSYTSMGLLDTVIDDFIGTERRFETISASDMDHMKLPGVLHRACQCVIEKKR